jgi:hypothetical protein
MQGKLMQRVALGKSGLEVSAVGFGGIPIQRLSHDGAVQVLHRAFELGVNFVDTAASYGDSEEKIGLAIQGRRDDVILASKSNKTGRDEFMRELNASLDNLGVDSIDLYQLHAVSKQKRWDSLRKEGGALEALTEAHEDGRVKHVGVTSHGREMAMKLLDEPVFETLQFPFNLVTSEPAEELIPKAREKDVGFIVMKPLCGGRYDNANLAFKYLNAFPDLVPIPGIETAEEIEEVVSIVESRDLLEGEDKEEADRIAEKLGQRFCRRCGYCEPCPEGVPVQMCMIFESMVKRMSREKVASDIAPRVEQGAAKCVECGECEERCPYDLPIMERVQRSREAAEAFAAE